MASKRGLLGAHGMQTTTSVHYSTQGQYYSLLTNPRFCDDCLDTMSKKYYLKTKYFSIILVTNTTFSRNAFKRTRRGTRWCRRTIPFVVNVALLPNATKTGSTDSLCPRHSGRIALPIHVHKTKTALLSHQDIYKTGIRSRIRFYKKIIYKKKLMYINFKLQFLVVYHTVKFIHIVLYTYCVIYILYIYCVIL